MPAVPEMADGFAARRLVTERGRYDVCTIVACISQHQAGWLLKALDAYLRATAASDGSGTEGLGKLVLEQWSSGAVERRGDVFAGINARYNLQSEQWEPKTRLCGL